MRPIIILFISFLLINCSNTENSVEIEQKILRSVFNETLQKVYSLSKFKIPKEAKNNYLIIYDSVELDKPNFKFLKMHFKNASSELIDTSGIKSKSKIDIEKLDKAEFKYEYRLKLPLCLKSNFKTSKYALLGVILFSKITLDKQEKFGTFYCTHANGSPWNSEYFIVYIKKVNNDWKVEQIVKRNLIF